MGWSGDTSSYFVIALLPTCPDKDRDQAAVRFMENKIKWTNRRLFPDVSGDWGMQAALNRRYSHGI